LVTEKQGRSVSVDPQAASYISRNGSTISGVRTSSWMCFVVFLITAACVRSGRTSASASPGFGDGQMVSISSSASQSRVTSARSASVPSRRSPVSSSSMYVVMPSLVAINRSPPRMQSLAGSRPASKTVRGTVASACSINSQERRAVSASRSTRAPAAASSSIALGVLYATPTFSSTSSVFSWTNSFSATER
jgi:hypothetical protein